MDLLRFLEVSVPSGRAVGRERAGSGWGARPLGQHRQPGDYTSNPVLPPLSPDQSLPEEEQQRVLGEEKMLNINKKQASSPASKKPSQEAGKVGRGHDQAAGGVEGKRRGSL